jgi:hypothetical protein
MFQHRGSSGRDRDCALVSRARRSCSPQRSYRRARTPAGAYAGTLLSATWTQTIQGVALTVTNSGAACTDTNPAHVPGAGSITCPTAGLQATGASTAASYNVALTMPLFEMQAFTTGGSINIGTMASLAGAQSIAGNAVSAAGTPGVAGTVVIGIAMHSLGSMWSQVAGATLLRIPISVGKAGVFTDTFVVSGTYHYITVDFYAWTPGTVTLPGLTYAGYSAPSVHAMGSFGLTPNGGGTVTLVAPTKVAIDGPLAQRRTAEFATLKLPFVPEPSALLLAGAGALALLAAGRRR